MQSEESHELTNEISEEVRTKSQKADRKKQKLKEKLLKEAKEAKNRGVCYLSRIPPHVDPVRLRQILSKFGEIKRIYLSPENPDAQMHRKKAGGFRGQLFSEGWVEFAKKTVAKRVADMLNGEQIGGKKKSSVYYDIWNIKYLSKFKWDDLNDEIAYKSAIRQQKLNMALSAAKREKDTYLTKVEKSRAMTEIDERMKKKRKIQEESGVSGEAEPVYPPRVIRQFRQKKSIKNEITESKPGLSTDVLSSVIISQMNGQDYTSRSHVFTVGRTRIKLSRGWITKAREIYSTSMQLCGVRSNFILTFESEQERNTAIALARRYAFDCNVTVLGPDD